MKYARIFFAFVITLMFSHSVSAQHTAHAADKVSMKGYCPVAAVVMNKAMKGDPGITLMHKGKKYVFANREAKKMFEAEPGKYMPEFDGYCATALTMGQKMESDPTLFSNYDGSLYLFSNKDAKKMFDKTPEAMISKAEKKWAALSK